MAGTAYRRRLLGDNLWRPMQQGGKDPLGVYRNCLVSERSGRDFGDLAILQRLDRLMLCLFLLRLNGNATSPDTKVSVRTLVVTTCTSSLPLRRTMQRVLTLERTLIVFSPWRSACLWTLTQYCVALQGRLRRCHARACLLTFGSLFVTVGISDACR